MGDFFIAWVFRFGYPGAHGRTGGSLPVGHGMLGIVALLVLLLVATPVGLMRPGSI